MQTVKQVDFHAEVYSVYLSDSVTARQLATEAGLLDVCRVT